jgi:hypothetical protein
MLTRLRLSRQSRAARSAITTPTRPNTRPCTSLAKTGAGPIGAERRVADRKRGPGPPRGRATGKAGPPGQPCVQWAGRRLAGRAAIGAVDVGDPSRGELCCRRWRLVRRGAPELGTRLRTGLAISHFGRLARRSSGTLRFDTTRGRSRVRGWIEVVRADRPLCHRGSRRGGGRTRRAGFRADRGPGEAPGAGNLVCGHEAGERRRDERRDDYSVASDHAGAVREALRICSRHMASGQLGAGHERGFTA